jgi:proline dehydrogenase
MFLFLISEILSPISIGFFVNGDILIALLLYIVKFLPYIVAFAIFKRGKDKLFSFKWFERLYYVIIKLVNNLTQSRVYIKTKLKINLMKKLFLSQLYKNKKNINVELFKEARVLIRKKIK